MKRNPAYGVLRTLTGTFLALLMLLLLSNSARAQAKSLITSTTDETKLVQLKGNVPVQLKGAQDLGSVETSQPSGRLMLVLKRSDEQETALQDLLQAVHRQGAASFHRWLAPGEFGRRFGASDSDIQQLTAWLQSHGLDVAGVSASRNTIEFSGSIGQVNQAFHTSIHKYSVKSGQGGALETHYSNATDPQVPEAFQAAVAGVMQLNDFKPKSQVKTLGRVKYDAKKHTGVPQWTIPDGDGPTTPFYLLAPEDFATQYDVGPVYKAGVNGAGQTIGIINDSNIDLSLVNAYRKLFGLPFNPPQVVIDGPDPGINGDAVEAYLDVENAGAVAPGATVKLYTAGSFGLLGDGGLYYSLLRAVNDDAASVLNLSFGECEVFSGTASNQFISSLWEQAASQGQTVLVSSGDSGSFDSCLGLGVNAFASTPWNVAVGGTDAYFTDYATGGASISTFWSNTNDANLGSLQKKFVEQPWNGTQLGLNSIVYDPVADQPYNQGSGGGGASACVVSTFTPPFNYTCVSGWPKPTWQVGAGVPADGVRDLPDVSLFASNGYNGITWPVCATPGDCTVAIPDNPNGDLYVSGVGGTSASAPAMAGVMALINQKYGPQGQANYVLYPLAAQFPAAFTDVTVGNNDITCSQYDVPPYILNCSIDTNGDGYYSFHNYFAGPGYDQASGLGTLDVNQLFTNWGSVTFKTSATTLQLSPTTFTHGATVTANATVTGTGTPAGAVALLANTTLENNKSVVNIPLTNGAGSTTLTNLPGGTYTVTGDYSGDGINAASVSAPVTVTVTPEASILQFNPQSISLVTYDAAPITSGASIVFNTEIILDVQIVGASGKVDGSPTGTVTFKDGSTVLYTASVSSAGTAEFNGASLSVGSHTISVSYSGDASYTASSVAPLQFNIVQEVPQAVLISDQTATYNRDGSWGYVAGQTASVTGMLAQLIKDGSACPTGQLFFQLGSGTPVVSQLLPCENLYYLYGSGAGVLFPNLQAGSYNLLMTYTGDANYAPTSATQMIEVTAPTLLPSTTTVVTTPSDLSTATPSTPIIVAITVSGNGQLSPTGTATLSLASYLGLGRSKLTPAANGTSVATFNFRAADLVPGPNSVVASYSGDSNYSGSVSTTTMVVDDPTDFMMQSSVTTTTIPAGNAGSVGITFTSVSGFNGSVNVSCTVPSGLICTPAATSVTLNGTGTTIVSIDTVTKTTSSENRPVPAGWFRMGSGIALSCLLFFILPGRRRLSRALLSAVVMMVVLSDVGCGGKAATPPTGPTTVSTDAKPGTYTVVIYGTGSNGIVHDVPVTVIVR